ncbi:MAG: Stp1/IreP family PP2C-type Ser/Thr phosphatase [Ignavibacteriaceae bacterium]|jgi:protein phosphatase|nr:Stp1/IreP family PP2C-type Ser/Thr phosphatase [Ignavibacteriaceae bacterium]
MIVNYIFASHLGKRRAVNEDCVNVFNLDDGLLSIVCDGLGGNRAGDVASKTAVETIYNYFLQNPDLDNLTKMNAALTAAHQILLEKGRESEHYKGMATTAVVVFIAGNTVYWGHIGDSRIYFFTENQLRQITKDHSLVQKMVDNGLITSKQAEKHPHRNIIVKALGEDNDCQPDCDYFYLHDGQQFKLLLCTDGLCGVLNFNEISKILSQGENLEEISQKFFQQIEDFGSPDNFSYVIINNI